MKPLAWALAALLANSAAMASDDHAKPDAHAKAPAAKAAVSSAEGLDLVRQRLAEKLAAHSAGEPGSQNLVRVPTRAVAPAKPARAARAAAAVPPAEHEPEGVEGREVHWAYAGSTGPNVWAHLKPEFATCATGRRQSPIDIRDGFKVQLEPVRFEYRNSGFTVVDNGHTIQVNVSTGNTIVVSGRRYELLQFHFHRPSEERIDGRAFDMVAHLVHKDADDRLAVVAVLLDRGSQQPLIQTVWNNLPLEKGVEQAGAGGIDLNALLPSDRSYYTYMGSLTTPPCSEGVLWMVMKQPVEISPQQLDIFSRLYPMNARPLQRSAGRVIKESE